MPEKVEEVTKDPNAALGLAREAMESHPRGSRWPFLGKTLLLIFDAYSKWIKVHIVLSTTLSAAIEKLRVTFIVHGLPETLVSDNGPAFVSRDFWGVHVMKWHQTFDNSTILPFIKWFGGENCPQKKEELKRMTGPLEWRAPRFLFKYHVTSQATTGIVPTELLMCCRIRMRLDLLYLTTWQRVRVHQMQQKYSDTNAHTWQFNPDDRVMGWNFADGPKLLPGNVLEGGKTTVKVKLDDGWIWCRHVDHLFPSQVQIEIELVDQEFTPTTYVIGQ